GGRPRGPRVGRPGGAPPRLRGGDGVPARRAPADHGASLLRLGGLPDDRVLRADEPLRHAAGPDGSRRAAASGGDRRAPRLGAVALPDRPAPPRALRPAAPPPARPTPPRPPP